VVQAQVEIEQAGQVVLAALASFGAARASQLQVAAQAAPEWPQRGMQLPDSDLAPEFTRHFDYRIQQGNAPFSGGNSRTLGGAIRFRGASDAPVPALVGVPELLALVDAWPPVSLGLMQGPAPASSLTWTLELLPQTSAFSGSDWWSYLANIEHGADGYHHIEAKCWAPDGSLIAISRQTVTVFA
jgi:acyl-CoA thioesterase